jgi:hypothetical protein
MKNRRESNSPNWQIVHAFTWPAMGARESINVRATNVHSRPWLMTIIFEVAVFIGIQAYAKELKHLFLKCA